MGVEIISTGGTYRLLKENGIDVKEVEEVTGFPEMLDGRVKTLHPMIHAGILARRDLKDHMDAIAAKGIKPIDMVVVNLYPFKQTVLKEGATFDEIVENIDIGGPSMIRAAAKNYKSVAVVTEPRQYDEIRGIYLDMRGWRHDYHNHLQVMKAELAAGQLAELSAYLDELEADLDRVDTYVKSGNLMVDAILNSKLSLAEKGGVSVTCKAVVPESLTVDDVDLCVILGNLLDNALESCEKLPATERWLRVYLAARGSQLYMSVQNSAVEDPSFNARNYITEKRGNHGLGMKRVAAVVDKYEGFLNLANEPGIFAAEVSLPL